MAEKTAIVTGASRGIGRAIALELAGKGYKVILNYCGSKVRAEQAAEEICARHLSAILSKKKDG